MRAPIISPAALVALASLLALAGCGGDDDSSQRSAKPAQTTTTKDAEALARAESRRRIEAAKRRRAERMTEKGRGGARKRKGTGAAARRRAAREDRREREDDRKFDAEFKETAFEKLLAKLPVRRPPLFVEQYITTEKSHEVYTAVSRRRFFCKLSAAQRRLAVERFYRRADEVMRAGGVKDFEQVVTVTAQTLESLPTLAVARRGSVSLTKLGRGKGPC